MIPEAELYYSAFKDLSTCRSVGMGLGPIPWDKVQYWCDVHALDPEQTDIMHILIRHMDDFYLEYLDKKREAEIAANKTKNKGRFGRKRR